MKVGVSLGDILWKARMIAGSICLSIGIRGIFSFCLIFYGILRDFPADANLYPHSGRPRMNNSKVACPSYTNFSPSENYRYLAYKPSQPPTP